MMSLRVHSIETLGALDGPGIRTVVFLQGCPLRCGYCHNPDTWSYEAGKMMTEDELFRRILRMKPYFKDNGGVTFSGGEPLRQATALLSLMHRLKKEGIHMAIDTSGAVWSQAVDEAIHLADLILLDIKHTNGDAFFQLTGGQLKQVLAFLDVLKRDAIPYWIRQVTIPGITDSEAQIEQLGKITASDSRERIELLPFHKMGMTKWEKLGISCPLADVAPMSAAVTEQLQRYLSNI
jgi:pyruvate formate lyase activating enzyme